jgi:hypothetical protein
VSATTTVLALASWLLGSLAPRLLGSLAPRLLGSLAPWLLGSLAPWLLDSLAPWLLGIADPRRNGELLKSQRVLQVIKKSTSGLYYKIFTIVNYDCKECCIF